MQKSEKTLLEGLGRLGMPLSAETVGFVKESPDLAAKIFGTAKVDSLARESRSTAREGTSSPASEIR